MFSLQARRVRCPYDNLSCQIISQFVAGTGKSVLLREIIKTFRDTTSTLGITASTGIASVNIGGTTIHSWAGIGLGQESVKNMAGKILGQSTLVKVRDRWREVQALIIDEGKSFLGCLLT
jgi:hypothetical protein